MELSKQNQHAAESTLSNGGYQICSTNGNGVTKEKSKLSLTKREAIIITPDNEKASSKGFYKLSNLDHSFPYPIEILFSFETKNDNNNEITEVLKKSLGKVLDEFYPLAGGVDVSWDERMLVDCGRGHGGVPFVEAICDEDMAVALGDITKIDDKLSELMYSGDKPYGTILDVPPLTVQVTRFKCGGIILGVGFNHILVDGRGFADVMLNWCQVAQDLPIVARPYIERSIYSASNPPNVTKAHPEYSKSRAPLIPQLGSKNELDIKVNRSFTFTPTKIAQLKNLATQNTFTSFEIMSALVWVSWTKAMEISPKKTTQIITAVDGRPKFTNPPLPKPYFGNGIVWSSARSKASDLTSEPFSYAVKIVHEAIKEVTENYVRSAIDYHEIVRKPLEQANTLWITKWSRLPFYEVEFTWGKPTQVAPASLVDNLVVTLWEGEDNENLVMSLSLPPKAMEIFEELMHSALE